MSAVQPRTSDLTRGMLQRLRFVYRAGHRSGCCCALVNQWLEVACRLVDHIHVNGRLAFTFAEVVRQDAPRLMYDCLCQIEC